MKTRRKQESRKGFTLVELLIVIIIIGILAGAMMLASFAATDKARAMRIAGEIRTMKAAALFYYNDEDGWPDWKYESGTYSDSPDKYLEREPVFDNYWLGVIEESSDSGGRVAVILKDTGLDQGVKKHLARMAVEMGYYENSAENIPASPDYYGKDNNYKDFMICFIRPE